MILVCISGAVFSLSFLLMMIGMIWEWDDSFLKIDITIVFLSLILCPVLYFITDSKESSFSLEKKDWVCTESHKYLTTQMMLVGKVMVPMTTTHTMCDNYQRIK